MPNTAHQASCRLDVLLARDAPVGVILRRGPTNWVQLIRWQTDDDTFEEGQWFHGRIYEGLSDLSPDGQLFLYAARKAETPERRASDYTHKWTAISKPPYFTALALWPIGDNWDGGGYFVEDRTVWLNHETARPHKAHHPSNLRISHTYDPARFTQRAIRDGWRLVQQGKFRYERLPPDDPRVQGRGLPILGVTDLPFIWRKDHPRGRYHLVEEMYREPNWKVATLTYLSDDATSRTIPIEGVNWVDWDQRGRLVFTRDSQLCAADHFNAPDAEDAPDAARILADAQTLADFAAHTPTRLPPPTWATRWPTGGKRDVRPAPPAHEPLTTDYPL